MLHLLLFSLASRLASLQLPSFPDPRNAVKMDTLERCLAAVLLLALGFYLHRLLWPPSPPTSSPTAAPGAPSAGSVAACPGSLALPGPTVSHRLQMLAGGAVALAEAACARSPLVLVPVRGKVAKKTRLEKGQGRYLTVANHGWRVPPVVSERDKVACNSNRPPVAKRHDFPPGIRDVLAASRPLPRRRSSSPRPVPTVSGNACQPSLSLTVWAEMPLDIGHCRPYLSPVGRVSLEVVACRTPKVAQACGQEGRPAWRGRRRRRLPLTPQRTCAAHSAWTLTHFLLCSVKACRRNITSGTSPQVPSRLSSSRWPRRIGATLVTSTNPATSWPGTSRTMS